LSLAHQRFIKRHTERSERHKRPRSEKWVAHGEEFDSKLEYDFADELEQWHRDRKIVEWRFHPMKFRLGKGSSYQPDFCTWPTFTIETDVRLSFYEVKGSWLAKNARDSRTRLQVAAYMHQWFNWYAVTRTKGGIWELETIHASDAEGGPMPSV
jgi:hypothetical protein